MAVDGRGGAEQVAGGLLRVVGDPALDPYLVDRPGPAGEHADAVAGAGDLVEVLVQGVPGQALEDPLADLVGRLDSRVRRVTAPSAPSPTTMPSKSGSPLRPGGARPRRWPAPGRRPRWPGCRCRPRSRGGGGHRPRDRDVGQRCQVVQGQPLPPQHPGQLPVGERGRAGDRAGAAVDGDLGGQVRQADQLGHVGDAGERVPGAEHPELGRAGHDLLELLKGGRPVQLGRPVPVVPGPVGLGHGARVLARAIWPSQVALGLGAGPGGRPRPGRRPAGADGPTRSCRAGSSRCSRARPPLGQAVQHAQRPADDRRAGCRRRWRCRSR